MTNVICISELFAAVHERQEDSAGRKLTLSPESEAASVAYSKGAANFGVALILVYCLCAIAAELNMGL